MEPFNSFLIRAALLYKSLSEEKQYACVCFGVQARPQCLHSPSAAAVREGRDRDRRLGVGCLLTQVSLPLFNREGPAEMYGVIL